MNTRKHREDNMSGQSNASDIDKLDIINRYRAADRDCADSASTEPSTVPFSICPCPDDPKAMLVEQLAAAESHYGMDDHRLLPTLWSLAVQYDEDDDLPNAEVVLSRIRDMLKNLAGCDRAFRAQVLAALGQVCFAQEKYDDADNAIIDALALDPEGAHLGDEFFTMLRALAAIRLERGQNQVAERLLRNALQGIEARTEEHDSRRACIRCELAKALRAQGSSEAEEFARQAVAIWKTIDPEDPESACAAMQLAQMLISEGNFDEAREVCGRAIMLAEKGLPASEPLLFNALGALSVIQFETGQLQEADATMARVLELELCDPMRRAGVLRMRAECCYNLGLLKEAKELIREGVHLFEDSTDPNPDTWRELFIWLANVLDAEGREFEADLIAARLESGDKLEGLDQFLDDSDDDPPMTEDDE